MLDTPPSQSNYAFIFDTMKGILEAILIENKLTREEETIYFKNKIDNIQVEIRELENELIQYELLLSHCYNSPDNQEISNDDSFYNINANIYHIDKQIRKLQHDIRAYEKIISLI